MIGEVLKSNSTLNVLNLKSKEGISDEKKAKNVKKVRWTANKIGVEGAKIMSEGLKSNSSLTKLNLSGENVF